MNLSKIKETLNELDAKAEALGAHHIRRSIGHVLEDLTEPAGKENARMAIFEFREQLGLLRSTASVSSSFPPAPLDEAAL